MMVGAPDFDRRMLFLATQLAYENKMRNLLLKVLWSLLQSLQTDRVLESKFEGRSIEGITLIRFVVGLIHNMYSIFTTTSQDVSFGSCWKC